MTMVWPESVGSGDHGLGRDRGIADDRGSDRRAKRPRLAPVVPPATADTAYRCPRGARDNF